MFVQQSPSILENYVSKQLNSFSLNYLFTINNLKLFDKKIDWKVNKNYFDKNSYYYLQIMKKPSSISMSKKLFPILATTGVIFISNSSFENSEKVSPSENTVQQLETMTFTASRADEVQEKSKQVTNLDEKQIELLKNGSSGNIATVLAKAVPGLSDSSRTITDYGQTLRGRNALILVDGVPMNLTRDTSRGLSIDPESIQNISYSRKQRHLR
jgi:hypothetical protein